MNSKRIAPTAIIDNFNSLDNPFKVSTLLPLELSNLHIKGIDLDFDCVLKFLYSYNGNTATFNSYRRELERLLQWSWRIAELSIITLRREHIEDFIQFCLHPPKAWIGTKNVARYKNKNGQRQANKEWRPFVASVSKEEFNKGIKSETKVHCLSQASIKAIFTSLSSFYEYLMQETIINANPVALIKQKSKFVRKDQLKPTVRRISSLQWAYVLETAEMMAAEYPKEFERTLFIMNCLFAMYLRVSELVADERSTPVMSDFRKDHDGNWWFHVLGKGNKNRTISVCDDMLQALKRYRQHLGLSLLPKVNEQISLVPKFLGKGPITSTRQIRTLVQACFDNALKRMQQDGLEEDAEDLKIATVHWLRHTGISEDVKFRPREHVRDDAGHASMATTDQYIDSDLRERHASAKKKKVKDIG
ncbi:Site specific recombinase, phage integrase [hydrothermal vent metagenome]|uniref:Site specific recombinase, phage integrase n=1 Tax=hydrothermal vent metagenome TaxID=652676 RepID=A0A3B0YFI6_9ZZZZ